MTWIKICGTTNLEDAQLSIAAGADALGFIFAESPRRISAAQAKKIIGHLPESVEKVGVFVNESVEKIREIVKEAGLTSVQLHGDEDINFLRALSGDSLRLRVYKVLPANSRLKDALVEFRGPNAPAAFLVDSAVNGKRGGTGQKSDWQSVAAAVGGGNGKWIIAGGLTPQNVAEAIQTLLPYGVDVVSGVEREPGKKDQAKVKAFVQAVRKADQNHERDTQG